MAQRSKWLSEYDPAFLAHGRQQWYTALEYKPKLGQRLFDEAIDAGKRFVGLFTPNQDGKSFHCAKSVGAYLLLPEIHIWLVGVTYQDASKEFLYLEQDLAAMGLRKQAVRWHHDIRGGNMHIALKNGSWVQVISAENPENLRREQLDVVVLCEASKLPSDLYQRMLYSRVERRHGKCLVPSTHKGYGWMFDAFAVPSMPVKPKTFQWGPWRDGRREILGGEPNPLYDEEYWSCQVSYVPEFGNVFHQGEYPPDVIEKARRRLPAPMFAEQFGGEAASYAGLVYPFDPTRHECDPFPIPREWTHVVGWDHGAGGGSDPTAIILGSYDPAGTLYVWGEIWDVGQHSIAQRGGLLKTKLNGKQPAAIMTGRDSKQVITELMGVGLIASCPPDWSVGARIIRVTELLQTGHCKFFRGRVPNTKREMLAYEWDEKRPGDPKDGNDHGLEGLGYLSLAPVGLPDSTVSSGPQETSPESRRAKMLHEQLWGELEAEERARGEEHVAGKWGALVEPDPEEVFGELVEAWEP